MSTSLVPRPSLPSKKFLSHTEIRELVQNAPGDIVAQFVPEASVNLVVGDSGLGKTPLLMQLALCVAAGVPFLGQDVRQGGVLFVDFENGLLQLARLQETLAEYLGLEEVPVSAVLLHQPSSLREVDASVREFQPTLVIVDALRGLDPQAERDNSSAAALIAGRQKIANELGTAWLLIHHIRKPDLKSAPDSLKNAPSVMEWLLQAAGARALVNQSAMRIGIDSNVGGEAELIIRGHYKLKGEFGPWFIARAYEEAGEAVGYRRLAGMDLLSQEQRERFALLPLEFTFSEAERIYGKKGGKPTSEWLRRCLAAGLLVKTGQGKTTRYRKTGEPHNPGNVGTDNVKYV